MYAYGKHLGLAFQVVDDILDFTQSSEQLGKPQGQDLASGNLTAPVIYALQVRTLVWLARLCVGKWPVACSHTCVHPATWPWLPTHTFLHLAACLPACPPAG